MIQVTTLFHAACITVSDNYEIIALGCSALDSAWAVARQSSRIAGCSFALAGWDQLADLSDEHWWSPLGSRQRQISLAATDAARRQINEPGVSQETAKILTSELVNK